jgi:hypothetical protein
MKTLLRRAWIVLPSILVSAGACAPAADRSRDAGVRARLGVSTAPAGR